MRPLNVLRRLERSNVVFKTGIFSLTISQYFNQHGMLRELKMSLDQRVNGAKNDDNESDFGNENKKENDRIQKLK